MISHNERLFTAAKKHIPGGVNSPVRSFYGVGGTPIFMDHGKGAYLYDTVNKSYADYVLSWGPLILGHAEQTVIDAVKNTAEKGLGFGTATELEIKLANKVCDIMPNLEMIRMVNSGTEATMTAIRLGRAFTQRDKIIKFEGCYHGHSDSLLVKAGSGALTLGVPSSPGVPADLVQHTLTATFNDLDSVQRIFEHYPNDIACIIVEPIAGNMNLIPGTKTFLQGLRDLCDRYHSVLIFDEVMTGFRITAGGAQHYYDIKPDLTTLGKVIGGGMPVGAFGGRKDIMSMIAPLGPVYQAGTLSGNPVAMAAGLATLSAISTPHFYNELNQSTKKLVEGLNQLGEQYHLPFFAHHVHSMFGFFFTKKKSIASYSDVMSCDAALFKRFYQLMLHHGVYFAPSAFETGFTSSAHSSKVIDETLNAVEMVFKDLQSGN